MYTRKSSSPGFIPVGPNTIRTNLMASDWWDWTFVFVSCWMYSLLHMEFIRMIRREPVYRNSWTSKDFNFPKRTVASTQSNAFDKSTYQLNSASPAFIWDIKLLINWLDPFFCLLVISQAQRSYNYWPSKVIRGHLLLHIIINFTFPLCLPKRLVLYFVLYTDHQFCSRIDIMFLSAVLFYQHFLKVNINKTQTFLKLEQSKTNLSLQKLLWIVFFQIPTLTVGPIQLLQWTVLSCHNWVLVDKAYRLIFLLKGLQRPGNTMMY